VSTDINRGKSSQQKQSTQHPQQQQQQQQQPGSQRLTGKTRDQESAREFLWSEQGSQAGRERQQGTQAGRSESEQQRRQRERNQPRS